MVVGDQQSVMRAVSQSSKAFAKIRETVPAVGNLSHFAARRRHHIVAPEGCASAMELGAMQCNVLFALHCAS
jgi:hypothetical protein